MLDEYELQFYCCDILQRKILNFSLRKKFPSCLDSIFWAATQISHEVFSPLDFSAWVYYQTDPTYAMICSEKVMTSYNKYICLTSLTRAKWNFPLNFRTMRKLSDLYSGICQNLLTCAKWNFPFNFHTMRKLSDLYSGIFQTQSSGCASGVDPFKNFTK